MESSHPDSGGVKAEEDCDCDIADSVNAPIQDSDSTLISNDEPKMSKNQMKKLRKREKWLEIKKEKRKEVKLKRKLRLAELREKGECVGPTRKSLKKNTMKDSSCKIKVALDLSLDDYMSEKDIVSLVSQIQHSYSSNRRAVNPLQFYLCGLSETGKTKQRLEDVGDYKGWDIYMESKDYTQAFPKESIVYLSSESPNVLTSLSEDKVYVIGGLVDHNAHKGLCHSLAEEKGISHAQLPISEYLHLKGRKVLPINHVFSILLRYTELADWKQAFLMEMPQRKGFSYIENEDNNDNNSSSKSNNEVTQTSEDHKDDKIDEDDKDIINEQQKRLDNAAISCDENNVVAVNLSVEIASEEESKS